MQHKHVHTEHSSLAGKGIKTMQRPAGAVNENHCRTTAGAVRRIVVDTNWLTAADECGHGR
ncbi:MAG TPA: hypothetical protein VGK01_22175 [Candidatus Angelobacter sp.]